MSIPCNKETKSDLHWQMDINMLPCEGALGNSGGQNQIINQKEHTSVHLGSIIAISSICRVFQRKTAYLSFLSPIKRKSSALTRCSSQWTASEIRADKLREEGRGMQLLTATTDRIIKNATKIICFSMLKTLKKPNSTTNHTSTLLKTQFKKNISSYKTFSVTLETKGKAHCHCFPPKLQPG